MAEHIILWIHFLNICIDNSAVPLIVVFYNKLRHLITILINLLSMKKRSEYIIGIDFCYLQEKCAKNIKYN